MVTEDSLRVLHVKINDEHFIATALHHRSEEEDPKDRYCIAYLPSNDFSEAQHLIPKLIEEVTNGNLVSFGFDIDLVKRGKLSDNYLGKVLASRILMDLVTGKYVFDIDQYDRIVSANDLNIDIAIINERSLDGSV